MTLVELAVAIVVLSLGTLAALRSLDQSQKATVGAELRSLAQIAVRNRAEELRLLGPSAILPARVEVGRRTFAITTDQTVTAAGLVQTIVSAQAVSGGGGAQLTIYLSPGGRQ